MTRSTSRGERRPPSSNRVIARAWVAGVAVAAIVLVAVTAVLVYVRSDAERDVDGMLMDSVQSQLSLSASQLSEVMDRELEDATRAVVSLAAVTVSALEDPRPADADEVARYSYSPDGSYRTTDMSGVSMHYSGRNEVGATERAKAASLSAIDDTLVSLVESNTLVVQTYVNTIDSLTRIYPAADVDSLFPPDVDVREFNFFYLADEQHDPSRSPVWTDVYVDPAGQGWITSVVAPVYVDDRLEAVAGVDITVSSLVGQLLSAPQAFGGYSLLLGADRTIMAMPAPAEDLFGLEEVTDADYADYVTADTFKPEEFNIGLRDDTSELAALVDTSATGHGEAQVGAQRMLVAWHVVEPMGWTVATMVPESGVAPLHEPGERTKRATTTSLWFVAAAFVLLLALVSLRGRRLGVVFTQPLRDIERASASMAAGDFRPVLPPPVTAEAERAGLQLLAMGRSLEEARDQMRRDAEQLREGEQRYRAIFDNVTEAVVTVDSDGVIVDANEAANRALGVTLPGARITDHVSDDVWRTPGRHPVQLDLPGVGIRDLEFAVGVSGLGEHRRYTITVHDVTGVMQTRRLLEDARLTAERTARLKDEFLASMSHEIRTPLNGVIGVLSLLAERELPPAARDELAVARRSADDLLVLVNDVLDFAKIEAGHMSIVARDVNVADEVAAVVRLYTPFAAEQGDRLVVEVDPAVPTWVRIDPTRVRQMLLNLVHNALKFTRDGEVVIRVAVEPGGGAHHFPLRFEVSDTGVGIDPEVQARLFTRFSQGDPLEARRFRGTGLGLAIVKRLAELMGGHVGVSSEPGRGSRFWFTVNASDGVARVVSPDVDGSARVPARALRVLVAEDNEVNRYLIVAILERLGHEVVAVENGREAVEAAERETFDVVLMDVQMPVANGIDATQAIRALSGVAGRVPILAVTANVLPEQQELYQRVGFTGWLPKPLTLDSVDQALAGVMGAGTAPPIPATDAAGTDAAGTGAAGPAAAPGDDLFDRALIAQHRELLGEVGADRMVTAFVESLTARRAELAAAVQEGDLDRVRRAGHTIKGMAASAGAVALARAGERVQHAEWSEVLGLVGVLEAQADLAESGIAAAWS